MEYIWQNLWDIFRKIRDIFRQNYWIFCARTIGYFMGYIHPKLFVLLDKNYGIYYGIYWLKIVWYI